MSQLKKQLLISFNDDEVSILEDLLDRGKQNFVNNLSIIDKKQILEIENRISNKVKKALYCPDSGVIDPFNLTYGFAENAYENGVQFFFETEVKSLEKARNSIILSTNKGEFETRYVVNAAGLNSAKIAAMAGDFMIYSSNNMKGLIHAGGTESPGLVSSPAIALHVIELLGKEGLELDKKENFNPIRKSIKDENENVANIICRCEQISLDKILEAINRKPGARNRDGIKRRVRAGMGPCQGAYCGPKVHQILESQVENYTIIKNIEKSGNDIVESYIEDKHE